MTHLGKRLHAVLIVAFVVAGLALRLPAARDAFLFGDELHSLKLAQESLAKVLTTYEPNGSGLALPLLQWVFAHAFGWNNWSIRLPALLGGVGALALMARGSWVRFGPTVALVATALLATNGFHVFYSHFARSYALASLMALALVLALDRLLASDLDARAFAAAAACAAALPYVHLAATSFVVAALAGHGLALAAQRAGEKRWKRWLACGGSAAALGTLLYLPALGSTLEFVGRKTTREYGGEFGFLDVATLLAGSREAALACGILVPIATVFAFAREGPRTLPLVLSALGPFAALWVLRPFGDAYAYARYATPSLPSLLLVLAIGLQGAARSAFRGFAPAATASLGLTLTVAAFFLGPIGPRRTNDGPHANTYMSLMPLPAFDVPWNGMPSIYADIAASGPSTVIEAPALSNRIRQLYRNYYLQHRQETLLAFSRSELAPVPAGPYVSLDEPRSILSSGASYVVLHRDAVKEADRYWRFVYEGRRLESRTAALMQRQETFGRDQAHPTAAQIEALERDLGPPICRDEQLVVWRLPPAQSGERADPPPCTRSREASPTQ